MDNLLSFLNSYALLIDAGLVVLIWMVQLIIYPSFLYHDNNLVKWHQKYTSRIALIVIPLMMYQLIFALILSISNFTLINSIYGLIVLALWLNTFIVFVPLHNKISNNSFNSKVLQRLISKNWLRTFLWTFLLFYHLLVL